MGKINGGGVRGCLFVWMCLRIWKVSKHSNNLLLKPRPAGVCLLERVCLYFVCMSGYVHLSVVIKDQRALGLGGNYSEAHITAFPLGQMSEWDLGKTICRHKVKVEAKMDLSEHLHVFRHTPVYILKSVRVVSLLFLFSIMCCVILT